MLDAAVSLGRDFGCGAAISGILPYGIAIVSPVGEQDAGIAVAFLHEVGISRAVVRLAGAQDDADGQTVRVGPKVDFGRETTSRTPKTLSMSPFFKPAAQ